MSRLPSQLSCPEKCRTHKGSGDLTERPLPAPSPSPSPALNSTGMAQPRSPQHLPFSFFPPPTNPRSAPSKADPPTPQRPSGCATSWDQPPCQRCYPSAHRTRHWPNFGEDGQRAETHRRRRNTEAPFPDSLFVTSPWARLHFPQFPASEFHEAKEGSLKPS